MKKSAEEKFSMIEQWQKSVLSQRAFVPSRTYRIMYFIIGMGFTGISKRIRE